MLLGKSMGQIDQKGMTEAIEMIVRADLKNKEVFEKGMRIGYNQDVSNPQAKLNI